MPIRDQAKKDFVIQPVMEPESPITLRDKQQQGDLGGREEGETTPDRTAHYGLGSQGAIH